MRHLYIIAVLLLCLSCANPSNKGGGSDGIIRGAHASNSENAQSSSSKTIASDRNSKPNEEWIFNLHFKGEVLPFCVELASNELVVVNGEERIVATSFTQKGDSTIVSMPIFNSELRYLRMEDSLSGRWYNLAKKNYSIPLTGTKDQDTRFMTSENSSKSFEGKWEITFSPNTEDSYPAIGVFKQSGNNITGTFLTETGDYRYLAGNVDGSTMLLSCFDGAHAFLFKAEQNDKGQLEGKFYSGKHWEEPWVAKRNEGAELSDPYKLTYLIDSTNKFNFSFPNLDSNIVSLSDERYQNKVVIIQIMGSWCPNCMDETAFLTDVYSKYNPKGLELISVCFESSNSFSKNVKSVSKLKEHFGTTHEYLIAGCASKKCAAEQLPQLNHIMSYPTTVFIDKSGEVRKIHTGFYGPGTGPYYEMYVESTTSFIESLLFEESTSAKGN